MAGIWSHELNYMNKRRSQIKYYVNNLTLTHYCQVHLSNSPSLPSPYYLPSLPLYFLLFLIPVPLLPSSYLICSFLPCTHSSLCHTIFTCIFFSSPYFLSFLVLHSLYILLPFLPCTPFSLHSPSLFILLPLLPPSLIILVPPPHFALLTFLTFIPSSFPSL